MKTTDTGYINKNNQKNLGYRGPSEAHISAKFYEMECLDCGHKYMANGCDIWLRKCPNCQGDKAETKQKIELKQLEVLRPIWQELTPTAKTPKWEEIFKKKSNCGLRLIQRKILS